MVDKSVEEEEVVFVEDDGLRSSSISRPWQIYGFRAEDDDSQNLFMSEPSISEADDSSEHQSRLLSPLGSLSGDEEQEPNTLLPPPPAPRILPPPPASPGNTSLSSWESPHFFSQNRQIQVHFSPNHREESDGSSATMHPQEAANNQYRLAGISHPQLVPPVGSTMPGYQGQQSPVFAQTTDRKAMNSSNSASPASSRDLNQTQNHTRMSSMDTAIAQNTSGNLQSASNLIPLPSETIGNTIKSAGADGTVVMMLSDDSGDEETKNAKVGFHPIDPTKGENVSPESGHKQYQEQNIDEVEDLQSISSILLDSEEKVSADDEKTDTGSRYDRHTRSNKLTPGQGQVSLSGARGHQRQRSGDVAAATLSTGSKEWKGMEQDNIPVPPMPGDHDDDDDDDVMDLKTKNGTIRNKARSDERKVGNSNTVGLKGTLGLSLGQGVEMDGSSKFSLGTSGQLQTQRYRSGGRYRKDALRGRKHFTFTVDSEDSSSRASGGGPSPMASQSIYAHGFLGPTSSGHLPSPDFSHFQPGRQATRPIHWSPQSHHSSYSSISPRAIPASFSSWTQNWQHSMTGLPEAPPTLSAQSVHRKSQSVDFDNQYVQCSPALTPPTPAFNTVTSNSYDSGGSNFSWLSARAPEGTADFEHGSGTSELSPLFGSRAKMAEQEANSMSFREAEIESVNRQRRIRFPEGLKSPRADVEAFHISPFARIGKRFSKADRSRFLPTDLNEGVSDKYTFLCPVCKTRQREFFTATNAPRQFESAAGYIAFYFGIYVIAALYIFGLQEGWGKLDCIYFAVITLTTAGLGDFIPTSDGAKVVCSIFIYFGVACIGLLLGSYIAGMLDESSKRAAQANRIKSCPNCVRIKNIKDAAERRHRRYRKEQKQFALSRVVSYASVSSERSLRDSKRLKREHIRNVGHGASLSERCDSSSWDGQSNYRRDDASSRCNNVETKKVMNSPSTKQILRRQSHSRHSSLDMSQNAFTNVNLSLPRSRKLSADLGVPGTILESAPGRHRNPNIFSPGDKSQHSHTDYEDDSTASGSTVSSDSTNSISLSVEEKYNAMKNARYVFLTLREALINSLVIIGFGCFGFYFIEGFSFVDSWYFTTVLLTTVGYGDLVPYTKGGKLFATVYILVAGTILLNNMSMISMIPLELRRRRIEIKVLTQFGDSLDDTALRELATGPLIRRLNLATEHSGGLDECTREMFCLAMLVRLGKVTEEDIKLTFAAFKKLDVNDENVLNSKAIIAGIIQKRRSSIHLNKMAEENQHYANATDGVQPSYGTLQPPSNGFWSTNAVVGPQTDMMNGTSEPITDERPIQF